MNDVMIKIEDVTKVYKLGEIGGTTLMEELQRLWAKIRRKEDPTKKIGAKNYNKGEKFAALNGVSFEVRRGEAIGLIGHNGAGKSTLLKLITRVTAPTTGKIKLNGRVASMLEVGTGFHRELTGRENIYMNGAILGMTKKEIDSKMEDIIEFSEVRQFIDTPVKRYSSGMFVKLAFSVAAHLDSEIVLMDEVLAVGDMAFQSKCIKKMREIADSGRTIIYVSHNMNTIRQLCDRCVVLNKGQVEFEGGVEDGIKVYLQKENDKLVDIDLSTKQRPEKYSFAVKMERLTLTDKVEATYYNNESLKMRMKFSVQKDVKDVLFRLTFRSEDLVPIMTTITKPFDLKKSDATEVDFTFDLSGVAPGNYFMYMSVKSIDSEDYDALAMAFKMEVINDPKDKNISWRSFMGKYKLPDMDVEVKR